jgi:GT2 family glycosyltransferase
MLSDIWRLGRRPAERVEVSIVICSVDEQRFNPVAADYARHMRDTPYELIRISDARSLCEGYNRGLDQARGKYVIFSHDDIEILTPDFRDRLLRHLERFDLLGIAGTTRLVDGAWNAAGQPWVHGQCVQPDVDGGPGYNVEVYGKAQHVVQPDIQAIDGVFMAARRSMAKSVRFDAKTFDAFHLYDIDFSFRAFRERWRLGVCNDILIYHASRGDYGEAWRHYRRVFFEKYRGKLDTRPRGDPTIHAREPVRTKEEAVTLFRYYLKQCGLAEAA